MFKHQIRVPYRDVTVGNHIYYARYLDYLEVSRNELFREYGLTLLQLQEKGIIFPVVECHLKYHVPARYDDLLECRVSLQDLGRVQFSLGYEIWRGETLLLTGQTRHAVTGMNEKPVRMPADVHGMLQRLQGAA